MPTIDQLPPATAASDTDEFMCNQGGISRKATLAQLLASTQPAIALTQGQLLGRADAGAGNVEPITIGANLTFADATLSGAAPFVIPALPSAAPPTPADNVPMAQNGQSVRASYAQFMTGIAGVAGVSGDAMTAQPTGTTTTRLLADLFANAVAAEDFGAVGDGVTDDTAALAAALAAGQPVRLAAKTYAVSGQWTIAGITAVLLGVPGQTTLKRAAQTGNGAWISVQAAQFRADGICFDANTAVTTDSWGVLVTPTCLQADFHRCQFANARGASMGCGLTFQAAYPAVTQHSVRGCEASGNAVHGIWVQALLNVQLATCRAHDNGAYGLCMDYTDPALLQKMQYCQISGCSAWNNQRGISVGNYNATNTPVPVWGNANPDAIAILVNGNLCHDNTQYGIAVAGQALNVAQNTLANNGIAGGAGLLANVALSRVAGNMVTGGSYYGIDAGGSVNTEITGNYVSGAVHGITPGGGQNVRVSNNTVQSCTGWSMLVNNVETDGAGHNFGMACANLAITDNWIGFAIAGGGGGILLADNPQNVLVARNCLVGSGGATVGQALWANSNAVIIEDNSWNFLPSAQVAGTALAGGNSQLVYPDLLDSMQVTAATGPVQSLISQRQQALAGQLGYIAVTGGGANYTTASATITGDGSGATAIAYVSNGALIGVALTNAGSGYTTATVSITGNGTGATAAAQIGLPVLSQRALTLRCAVPVVFKYDGASPPQQNWTNADFTVPANSEVRFTGAGGTWFAGVLPLADYIAPDGAGGTAVTTQSNGDLVLKPGGAGHLRIASSTEAVGVSSSIGRGSPSGVVSATPGSDYRNLNGGVGATYWIKQTGTSTSGWVAVA